MLKKIFLLLAAALLFFSCDKYVQLKEDNLRKKNKRFMEMSMNAVGSQEYWNVFAQIGDSIKNWNYHKLKSYDEDTTLVQFQVNPLICFNSKGDKMITTSMGRGLSKDDTMDAATYLYGVKIKGQWYFFDGPTMHIPREFYQKDVHIPLSFEKLKLITIDNMYSGYLKKNLWGKWEINEGFFSDLIPRKSIEYGGYESCSDCKTEEEYYLYLTRQKWLP